MDILSHVIGKQRSYSTHCTQSLQQIIIHYSYIMTIFQFGKSYKYFMVYI